MGFDTGSIIPFQYKSSKKLLVISAATKTNVPTIFDIINAVRSAFKIESCDFYNKKIGFHIPDELLIEYLYQRHDLTNFVIEVVDRGHIPDSNDQQQNSVKSSISLKINSYNRSSLQSADCYVPECKKLKKEIPNPVDLYLNDILKTSEGQALVHNYNNTQQLTEKDREYLVNFITSFEMEKILMLDRPFVIESKRYIELTDAIVRKFPTELHSYYYYPPSKILQRISGGKLFEHFTFLKSDNLENTLRDNVVSDFPELCELLDIEDWDPYFKAWQESFVLRRAYTTNMCATMDYFKNYIARMGNAIALIEYDFEILNPGKSNHLFDRWDQISEKIFTEAIVRGRKDVPKIMDLYGKAPQLAGFMLLGYFLNNFDVDVKDFVKDDPCNLIVHFDSIEGEPLNVFKEYNCKRNRMEIMVFMTGTAIEEFRYYVLVGEILHSFETAIKAVDFAFKCGQALCLLYSNEQNPAWVVIQSGVYDMDSYDENPIADKLLEILLNSP